MIDQRDPLDRLRVSNPVPIESVARLASSDVAIALLQRIVTESVPDGSPRRAPTLRRRRRIVPAIAAVSLCFGAVAYALVNRQVSEPETVACFAAVDLEARAVAVVPGAGGGAAACAELWARGVFGAAAVPALVECVLASGAAGVFPAEPGQDPCLALSLTAVASEPSATPQFGVFQRAVLERFLASSCVDPGEGRAIVRRELDRAGLDGWTVRETAAFGPDRPCASLGFDVPGKRVLLVPGPMR